MTQDHKTISVLMLVAWITLAIFLIFSPDCFIYDEYIYYQNLNPAHSHFSFEFIRSYKGTAGILSTWFHVLIYPLTNGDIVLMRVTNFIWFLLSGLLLNKIICEQKLSDFKYTGYLIIFLPSIFNLNARNMGDFPAFFFACLFYFCIQKIHKNDKRIYWYILTGFIGSLAIAGKQTLIFLLIFPVYSVLKNNRVSSKMVILLATMLILPIALYSIWGGVLPKSSSFKMQIFSLNFIDFIYALAYVSFFGLTISKDFIPSFLVRHFHVKTVISCFLTFGFPIPFPFFNYALSRLLSLETFITVKYFWSFIALYFSISGLHFISYCFKESFKKRADSDLILFLILFFLVFLKLPVYTGRYAAMASPFILLILLKSKKTEFTVAGLVFGLLYNVFEITLLYTPNYISDSLKFFFKTLTSYADSCVNWINVFLSAQP